MEIGVGDIRMSSYV